MNAREEILNACKRAGLSVLAAANATGIPSSTIYSWTAPEWSKHLKKPLPATIVGFKVLLALHTSKTGVFVGKDGVITQK